jgi:hypothetical protein
MDDFGRLDTLIKLVKSCIFPRSANKNILPLCNTSRCWRTNCEEPLKCHNFVTLDSSTQNARFHIPLQNSAVGFRSPVNMARSRLNSIFGDFFCARCLAPNGGRAGAPSGAPVPCSGLLTLSGPPPRLEAGLVGNKCNMESRMTVFARSPSGLRFPLPYFSRVMDRRPVAHMNPGSANDYA